MTTGGTSYDKVNALICQTPEWRSYADKVRLRLQTWNISLCAFDVKHDAHNPQVYFRVKYDGADQDFSIYRCGRDDMARYQVDLDDLSKYEEMKLVAKYVWDRKGVHTFNCKLDFSEKGPKKQNYVLKSFPEYGRNWIREKLQADIEAASARVREQAEAFYAAPDFCAVKHEAIETAAVNEIRTALLRFRHLDDSVLRRAFMEFVAQDVLET